MKKSFFLLAFAILAIGSMMAKPVDVETAKCLGVKFMMANTSVRSEQAALVFTAQTEHGDNAFYVFSVQPKGFVIVSADDRMKPILGYSTESNFHRDNIADGLMTFFDNYKSGVVQMIENDDDRTEQAVADWTRLAETGKINDARIGRAVAPLLASIWNQTDLYNNMAPEDPTSVFSGRCKSGCVANAMSQIMRYWEWPRQGEGSHSYYASSYYGWQQADFGAATYQFELMPDYLDFASPQNEVDAVALLEYHAGVSVEMNYGPSASGAYSSDVPDAMVNYFRYSNDMSLQYLDNQTQWENGLRANLDGGMPLYYASNGEAGGHAYVLDGYDDNNLFHLNWGWAGWDNGYFAIDGFYLTYYSFPWYHNAIFNIHPDEAYYNQPKAVLNLDARIDFSNFACVEFDPVFETLEGHTLNSIDTIVVMRDGIVIERMANVSDSHVSFAMDELPSEGTYYYSVYAKNGDLMSKVIRDTVVLNHGSFYKFDLHDLNADGWDMSFVAVLDSSGKVMGRAGLMDGGHDEVIMPVPCDQDLTLFWTYDNVCYSHGTVDQCSFEVYDETDNLLFDSPEVLLVGPLSTMYKPCYNPGPDFISAEYVIKDDAFGVEVTWAMEGQNDFELLRYDTPEGEPVASFVFGHGENSYFDEVAPGVYYYRVCALYPPGCWYAYSDFAPNIDDPTLDYAFAEVTSLEDLVSDVEVVEEMIFDMSGREVRKSEISKGIYVVRQVMSDGSLRSHKVVR